LGNGKRDQALDRVSRAMAGRSKRSSKHLGLWNVKARPPPEVKVPPVRTKMDYSDSQVSSSE